MAKALGRQEEGTRIRGVPLGWQKQYKERCNEWVYNRNIRTRQGVVSRVSRVSFLGDSFCSFLFLNIMKDVVLLFDSRRCAEMGPGWR